MVTGWPRLAASVISVMVLTWKFVSIGHVGSVKEECDPRTQR